MSVASADRIQIPETKCAAWSVERGLSRMNEKSFDIEKATSDRKREISLPFGSTILWYLLLPM
ncbi:hypothetical protein EAF00_001436 [Botryotinia globosa]|nr:hypothetical protein EAF00_001436 [Botryotinia globosa]